MATTEWLDMMPDTVDYEAVKTRDAYGKVTAYKVKVSYRARVRYHTTRVVSRVDGQDVTSSVQVWIHGILADLDVDDRFTLPDESTPVLLSWDQIPDEHGTHHQKLYFGSA